MKRIFKFIIFCFLDIYLTIKDYIGNHYSFKYGGIRFADNGELHVVYKVKLNRKILSRPINELLNDDEDLCKFSPLDVKKICESEKYSSVSNNINHTELHKIKTDILFQSEEKIETFYTPLFALYCSMLVTAIYLSPNLIKITGFIEPRGILIFLLTYVVADVISEIYGLGSVLRMIKTTMCILILLAISIKLSMLLSPHDNQEVTRSLLRKALF